MTLPFVPPWENQITAVIMCDNGTDWTITSVIVILKLSIVEMRFRIPTFSGRVVTT
jgi:hypothetical protein